MNKNNPVMRVKYDAEHLQDVQINSEISNSANVLTTAQTSEGAFTLTRIAPAAGGHAQLYRS